MPARYFGHAQPLGLRDRAGGRLRIDVVHSLAGSALLESIHALVLYLDPTARVTAASASMQQGYLCAVGAK